LKGSRVKRTVTSDKDAKSIFKSRMDALKIYTSQGWEVVDVCGGK